MKNWALSITILALVAGMVLPCVGADGGAPLILDVRTEAEWNNGHVEGAVLIPHDQVGEKIGAVAKDKSKRIYLYCRTGRRTKIAEETLKKLGYRDVVNLETLENAAKTLKRKVVK